jgi:hypothetical protein
MKYAHLLNPLNFVHDAYKNNVYQLGNKYYFNTIKNLGATRSKGGQQKISYIFKRKYTKG